MACIYCGKEISEGNSLVVQGNPFCNNLCRYSYEKVNGKPKEYLAAKAIKKVAESEKRKWGKMFPKIDSKATALKTIKDVSIIFYFIAAITSALGFFFAKNLLIDAGICLLLGLSLQTLKSRIAAVLMFAYSLASLYMTVLNKFHAPQNLSNGGSNIVMSIIVLIAAYKAIEATFKYHSKYKKI